MSNTPAWELRFLDKSTEHRGKIGVGWNNEDGSIRIKLNPLVHVQENKDLVMTLFPYREGPRETPVTKTTKPSKLQKFWEEEHAKETQS